jgi:predicted aspartyl protease
VNLNRTFPAACLTAGLLFVSLSPAPAAKPHSSAPSLATILAKHLRAAMVPTDGSSSRAATQTVYAIHAGPMSGSLTEWAAPQGRSRVEMALGPVRQTDGDDGKVAWQQDSTGNVRVIRGPELIANRATSSFSLESYDPLKGSKKATVTLRPHREPGTGDYIIDVAPTGGVSQTLYLDPKTYLVRKMVSSKGGMAATVNILDYRTLNGERIPAHMQISYGGLPLVIQADLVQAKRLGRLDATLFTVPASATDCQFLTPNATSATLPFDDANNEIIIPVVIKGQTHHFLLDSGSAASFITASTAKSLGLKTPDAMFAFGYGGATATGLAAHAVLELPGGVRLVNQNLYVLKDPKIGALLAERGVEGGLGYDLLARLTVTIDYAHKTLTLTKPDAFTAPTEGVTTIPLSLDVHVPTVTAAIDGKASGKFLVDTGDSGSVHLYAGYARANGLTANPADPNAQTQTGAGIGGQISETITPGHTLLLGGSVLTGIPVATSTDAGISGVSLNAGGIGNQTLRRFNVTFDYAHAQLLLQQPAVTAPTVDAKPAVWRTSDSPALFLLTDEDHTTPAMSAVPMTTEAVLARHLKALGGRTAVAAIKSTRVKLTLETGGITGTGTTLFAVPDKELETTKLGINDSTEGYDGKQAWQSDSNGNIRMLGEDERRDLRRELYIDTNSYVLPEEGIPGVVKLRPQREAGTGDYILDLLPKDGKPDVLYLDPKTFLIAKEEHYDDNVLMTTTFQDYKPVDGVQFPFSQRTTNGMPRYDIVIHVQQIKNNLAVASAQFSPPSAMGSKTAFLTPGAKSATFPFTLEEGEIAIPITINGLASRVYLDSGASGLALSQTVADTLHLKGEGVLEARGYGGSTDLHPVKINTFDVGGAVRLSDLAAVAIALPPGLDQTENGPIAGFIGYDLLSHFVTKIDYANRTITLTDPSSFQPTADDGKPLPLDLDNDLPSITAQFDGLAPAQFLMDTGDVESLRLYGPYVTQNKISEKYPKQIPSVGGGIGGASKSQVTKTGSFTVDGVTLHGIPTSLSLDTKGGASQILAGSLGSGLLSRFVITFDYPHSRVFFAPNPDASTPYDTRTFGLTIASVKDQLGHPHIVIVDVKPDSPAAKAGVVQFDQILAIDDQSVKTMTLSDVRSQLSPTSATPTHTLSLFSPTGERRTLTVTLYDPLS